jgi:hypothetical protein
VLKPLFSTIRAVWVTDAMADKDLNGQRLAALHDKIVSMQERLKLRGILHKDHKATASELLSRHQILHKELEDELLDCWPSAPMSPKWDCESKSGSETFADRA